jgi:hypothetical protein
MYVKNLIWLDPILGANFKTIWNLLFTVFKNQVVIANWDMCIIYNVTWQKNILEKQHGKYSYNPYKLFKDTLKVKQGSRKFSKSIWYLWLLLNVTSN